MDFGGWNVDVGELLRDNSTELTAELTSKLTTKEFDWEYIMGWSGI